MKINLADVRAVALECSYKHGVPISESVPVGGSNTEKAIERFLVSLHDHQGPGELGMKGDLERLTQLLTRLCTTDLAEIAAIAKRRNLKIEFEG